LNIVTLMARAKREMAADNSGKKLFCISLGCPKNLVDSEVMLGILEGDGWQVCDAAGEASMILVNTCGFIRSAVEEAVDEILQVLELKKEDPSKLVVVTGCLVQRYGEELRAELPEVDLFIGTDGFADILLRLREIEAGHRPLLAELDSAPFLMNSAMPRRSATPFFRRYLKITEGCSNRCSYCMIPSIRGRLRRRDAGDLLAEAQQLEAAGVRELTLVGQDLTAYGLDLGKGAARLPELVTALLEKTDIPWLRMLYLYPNRVTDELLGLAAAHPRVLPYLISPCSMSAPRY